MIMDMLSFWDDVMEKLCFGKGILQEFDMGLLVPTGDLSGIWQGFSGDIRPFRKALQGTFRDFGELSWNFGGDFSGISGIWQGFQGCISSPGY